MDVDSPTHNADNVMQAVRARALSNAVAENEAIDPRTYNSLALSGLLKGGVVAGLDTALIEHLRNPGNCQPPETPRGPFLFRAYERRHEAVFVPDLLFVPDSQGRQAVLSYLSALAAGPESACLGRRGGAAIASSQEAILAADAVRWRPAAESVYDLITADFELQLAGLRQGIALRFDQGLQRSLPALLRPSIQMLDSIGLRFRCPAFESAEVDQWIKEVAQRGGDLRAVIGEWYSELGYLPLAPRRSVHELVKAWSGVHGAPVDLWDQLWSWADSVASPLANYHALTYYLSEPAAVPSGKASAVWRKCTEIIAPDRPAEDKEGRHALQWSVRARVAEHYLQYLECALPAKAGDALPALAWWLTERMTACWEASDELLRGFHEKTMERVAHDSRVLRQCVHPMAEVSAIRYATLYGSRSVWASAVAAQMEPLIEACGGPDVDADSRRRITSAFRRLLVECYPHDRPGSDLPTYAFEGDLPKVAHAWVEKCADPDDRGSMEEMLAFVQESRQEGFAPKLLDLLVKEDRDERLPAAFVLRALAYRGRLDPEELWKRFAQDEEWRKRVLSALEPEGLEAVVDMLVEVSLRAGDRWPSHLPHFIALAAEGTSTDRERQRFLFLCTLWASIATDGVSAVRRLLSGGRRHDFAADVDHWRTLLARLRSYSPGWVRGRLGAVLSVLHSP